MRLKVSFSLPLQFVLGACLARFTLQSSTFDYLQPVVQAVVDKQSGDSSTHQSNVANMMACLDTMNDEAFKHFILQLNSQGPADGTGVSAFVRNILSAFRGLISTMVYDEHWNSLIMLMNSIILKTLGQVSRVYLQDYYGNIPYEQHIYQEYLLVAIAFVTQPGLQLEQFSQRKYIQIVSLYNDMRLKMGFEVETLWSSLHNEHKLGLAPHVAGSFLEMTLLPTIDLRKMTIPILFDMMMSRYNDESSSIGHGLIDGGLGECDLSVTEMDGKFEEAMVMNFDKNLNEAGDGIGSGDEEYKLLFQEIVTDLLSKYGGRDERLMCFSKFITGVS